ncbi:MAG: efflux RND transporter periplasmic adaptor subunit [Deltaproteobacteria bacterium]|nr:MAG: efflux RND transporter periplasmic adaptor subunit [Deltaproteobacteria bacterium]
MPRPLSLRRLVTVLALTLPLTAGCGKEQSKGPPAKPPVPVRVAKAASLDVPLQVRAVGTVEARSTVEVRSRVSGQLAQVHFREGQDVRRGAPLFTIDPTPFQVALRQAEARLQRDQALAAAARDKEKRYLVLTGEGLVSRQDFELIKAEADSLEAAVAADRAAVDEAKLQLSWCYIAAPLTGRAGSLMAHAGDLVTAGGSQPLVVIHQVEPIDVSFTLPEKELARIRSVMQKGTLAVTALLPGEEQKPESGELTFIDNAVDTRTGTIRLKASFANAARRLWPGQFVTAVITLATFDNATVVPAAAVQTGQKGTYLYVARSDGTAELRPVTTGIPFEETTVISEGVKPGETVVVDGQLRLYPDAKLDIKR